MKSAGEERTEEPSTANGAAEASTDRLGVWEFDRYALVIDARSPHEYAEDHLPGAVNLPVVDDAQYAEVGIRHKTDKHGAYIVGVEYSLRNIADQIKPLISRYMADDRFLVYCFRGGKRSRLWADNLRTIGFEVDQLQGGWKRYRQWVRESLATLPKRFGYRVLAGPTGCGKTRLLAALAARGEQALDLEELASHRGSLLGDLPGRPQPTQKLFDSLLLATLRRFDPARVVWVEAESKKIGNLQLPDGLFEAMHRAPVVRLSAPMTERVNLWKRGLPPFRDRSARHGGQAPPAEAFGRRRCRRELGIDGGARRCRSAFRERDVEALRPLLCAIDAAQLCRGAGRGCRARRTGSPAAGRGGPAPRGRCTMALNTPGGGRPADASAREPVPQQMAQRVHERHQYHHPGEHRRRLSHLK